MNKKMLAMLNDINDLKKKVIDLTDAGKLDEAKEAKEDLKAAQEKFDLLKDVVEVSEPVAPVIEEHAKPANKKDPVKAFADAARARFANSMNEGTPTDGGYTVPEDIQTRINEYRDAKVSLIDLVTTEPVSTKSGARTYKNRSQQTGFVEVAEGAAIPAKATPQFSRITYSIKKYAGFLPVTNELFEDSDANITNLLTSWLGDESRVTRNKLILSKVESGTATAIAGTTDVARIDSIKDILNKTLGQAFKPTSTIITNDDGLAWLDKVKDSDNNYILNPDPTAPANLRLRTGATVVPLMIVPDADMPSDTTTTAGSTIIPFVIGDLKAGIKFFDRQQMTLKISDIATAGTLNAFDEDMTLLRAIEREDCVVTDAQAYVYATLTLAGE